MHKINIYLKLTIKKYTNEIKLPAAIKKRIGDWVHSSFTLSVSRWAIENWSLKPFSAAQTSSSMAGKKLGIGAVNAVPFPKEFLNLWITLYFTIFYSIFYYSDRLFPDGILCKSSFFIWRIKIFVSLFVKLKFWYMSWLKLPIF